MNRAQRSAADFASKSYKASLGADVRGLQQTIRAAKTQAEDFADRTYQAVLGADDSDVTSEVRSAEAIAGRFARQAYEAALGLDTSEVTDGVAQADRLAEQFAGQTYTATLGLKGAERTTAELKAIDSQADRLDGREVDINVDQDGSSALRVANLSTGFKSLASNIRATGTVLAASAIPFGIAAIGGAAPAIAAVAASAAGLALSLGRAALGFGLVAGAAGGGALVGLMAYGRGIAYVVSQAAQLRTNLIAAESALVGAKSAVDAAKQAVNQAKPGTKEYALAQMQLKLATEQLAEAQREYRRQQILNTPAARAFNNELTETRMRLTQLQAAIGRQVFPQFTKELDAWNEIITEFTPKIARTAGTIAGITTGFTRWFRTADQGQVLARTLDFINSSAVRGAQVLALIGRIGISALQPIIPLASRLQGQVLLLARRTDQWVESARGQRRITRIFHDLWNEAKRIGPVLLDLGRGITNIFDALDRTGLANQATRGLEAVASGFEHITRRGTEGRRALNRFLNNARELMPHVGRAVLRVARAVGEIADAAIRARQHGHRLTILQEIFRGIGRAARPLRRLVVGTFQDLGPEMAKLIPRLARFFNIFAGSSGPLVTFVRVINRALRIFNNLPDPVKRTAANLLALKLIFGALGLNAVVGALARFGGNALIARKATKDLTPAVAGAGAAAATTGGRFKRLRGFVGALLGGFRVVARFLLGPWGIALAGAVTAGVLIYKNWDRIKRAAKPLLETFGNIRDAVAPLVRLFGRALSRALGAVAKGFVSAVAPGFKLKDAAGSLAGALQRLANRVLPVVADAVRGFDKWVRRNHDTLVTIGRVAGRVVVSAFGLLRESIKFSITVVRDLISAVKFGIGIFRGLVRAVSAAARAIGGAFQSVVKRVTDVINAVKSAWQALPDWFREAGGDAAWGFIRGFTDVKIAKWLLDKVKGAWDEVRKWGEGNSPWKRTERSGRDAALGFVAGMDGAGPEIDRAARAIAERATRGMTPIQRTRFNARQERRNAFALQPLHFGAAGQGPVRKWDVGDPKDMVSTILNSQADTIGRGWAKYLVFHLNRMTDKFRFSHREDIERLAPRLRRLGYSGFEDLTFVRNQQMQRYQANAAPPHRGAWQRAPSAQSAGGRGITIKEMAFVLKEHAREMAGLMQAGMADAPNLRAFKRQMDRSLGGYLNFTNGLGAEPQ